MQRVANIQNGVAIVWNALLLFATRFKYYQRVASI